MKRTLIQLHVVIFYLIFYAGKVCAQNAVPAVISNISEGSFSAGYVYWQGTTVIDAQVGKWEFGPSQFSANSTLLIEIEVNDGGIAYFDYATESGDTASFNIDVIPSPPLTVQRVHSLSHPFAMNRSAFKRFTVDLTPYRQQNVVLQFNASYGQISGNITFEARALIEDLQLATCQVAPLTPLTDPDALVFEGGNTTNTDPANFNLNTELSCFSNAIGNSSATSGTLTSAYRPPTYQTHLREVYTKQMLLVNRREPECVTLKAEVQADFNQHGIIRRPAKSSNHSRGNSFDFAITGLTDAQIDGLAATCGLTRPDPVGDRVHFSG